MLFFRKSKRNQRQSPLAARRYASLEQLEPRHLLSALPLGATPEDTAEFMIGRVAVVPVLFESDGRIDANTQNWTTAEIDSLIAKVRTGVEWWAEALDRLNTVHELEFVIDDSFARTPFPTAYEPIDRRSQDSNLYIAPFLRAQGISQTLSLEDGVRQFNHAARERLGTDWAFSIFIADSSDDDDGAFAPGSEFSIAFAYPGGLYIVSPSGRPASTFSHEMGHIFWARDEYAGGGSWTDRRGYYNAQNLNAADNPTPGFNQEVSIMRAGVVLTQAYQTYTIPASTRAMIGWLDSDGDEIFDVADVPLHLEGEGRYDSENGVFTFDGNARAVPLPNQNSSGPKNDITLNRIDRIQYRIDNGPWLTASTIGAQVADIGFEITIDPFEQIEIRAIDDRIGVTSAILTTNSVAPLVSGASIGGYAFIDSSGEGESDPLEASLSRVNVTLTKADGSPLIHGEINADAYPTGVLPQTISGATLSTNGLTLDGRVGVFSNQSSNAASGFHFYNRQSASWQKDWAQDRQFVAVFAEPVGRAQINAIGIYDETSYGRLEAYDSSGNLITRFTTTVLREGQTSTMSVEDPLGRIKSIRAFGHGPTNVALDNLEFGTAATVVTNNDGVFRFPGLPDGTYRLSYTPERAIHRLANNNATISVVNGVSSVLAAAFERVPSPWLNPINRFDVDGNGNVQALDALRIINEIARNGSRILSNPSQINHFFDTSDDGAVTALDALRVINQLSRRNNAAPESETPAAPQDTVFALWDPSLENDNTPISAKDFPDSKEQTGELRF